MNTAKIIRGTVNSRGFTITSAITQWDYGWQFIPEIDDLPPTYRLDFSNEEKHGTALPVYCSTEGAEVPAELIDTGKDVWVWFVRIGDGFGITEYKWRIPNKCKPKTEQDEPTPTQQSSIDQLIVRSNEAVESAAQSASAASQSARESAESARASGESALSASNSALSSGEYASNALGYAESASASATASAQSASQSAQIKTDVEDMVDDAQASASASAQSATASANSASQASGYAQSASASAQSASGYASSAQTSAQTASSKATEASQSASTASTKASEASASALTASGYASQAESAKTASQTAQGLAESARDDAIDAKTDAESARDEAQNIVDGISAKAEQIDQNTADIASLEEDRYKPYVTDSASGSIASFPDGADDIPLKSLVVNIDPVQDISSGDPSPENICPISGWTGMEIQHTGKNLCGGSKLLANAQRYLPGGIVNEEEEYFQFTAGAGTANPYRFSTGVPFKENTQYTFILTLYKTSGTVSNMRVYYKDGSYSTIPNLSSAEHKETIVYTSASNKTILALTKANQTGNTRIYYNESGIFEGILTADQFEQFGKYIPINWQTEAGTVYGGKLDVLSGKLTVYPYYASYNGETLTGRWISDRDKYVSGTTPTIGAQVVNIGAQGVTVQLDPHEVASLYGVNNLWADSGDIEVEYRADTKAYIAKKIAEAISALS